MDNAVNLIVIAILALMISLIVVYIVKQRKKGVKCIGCPYAKECGGRRCRSEKSDRDGL